jgi:hypothetical protein
MNTVSLKILYRIGKVSQAISSESGFQLSFLPQQRILWYRNPKCGQSTVDYALRNSKLQYYRASADIPLLPMFSKWRSFGFVRQPETRFLSLWKNKVLNITPEYNLYKFNQEDRNRLLVIDNFIDWVSGFDLDQAECHMRKQIRLVPPDKTQFVGRIENFDRDWNRLSTQFGLGAPSYEIQNETDPSFQLTRAQRDKINDLYKEDNLAFYKDAGW